jgi:epoxyqueuosine reductase
MQRGATMTAEIKAAIRQQALALGFEAVGFAPPSLAPEARAHLAEFIARGYHGDMSWLAQRAAERTQPMALWPEVKSVVVLGLNYGPAEDPLAALGDKESGAVSVYARNRDYHDLVKSKLKALARWTAERWPGELKVFVDTAPVMEKPLAQAAGLGWQGKHTNLVSREFGSWLFLGEIYLSLDLEPDAADEDHCGACTRCLDVCPTRAFDGPYRLEARRCISYLTIEHKGHIDASLRPLMGNRIYGCDDCLAVCPWNKFAQAAREPKVMARAAKFAGSPVKRIGRDRFLRNVLIAIGNSGNSELVSAVTPHLADPSPLVRAMAVWALTRLGDAATVAKARAERLPEETDDMVRGEWQRAA